MEITKYEKNIIDKNNEIFNFISLEQIIYSGIKKCVCKIIREVKINHKQKLKSGTGFFCYISPNNIKVFITNNHVLDQNFLDKSKSLIYYDYNNEKKEINLELNRYKYTDQILDFTIIEIIKDDNIFNFLEIDENINTKDYKNEQIFSIQFPGESLQYSHGKNYGKNKNFFLYSIGTLDGSSGSPILLIKNRKLIGLHKGNYNVTKNKKINMGIPINLIIDKIDYIKCIYNIKNENIGKEIQIMNNKYYNYDLKKFIYNGEIENKVKVMINGEKKSNIFKYIFHKEGKYKLYFYKDITLLNISGLFYNCDCIEKMDLSSFKTNNIINASGLFSKCSSLKEINLKSFKSSNIRNASWMFDGCSNLKEIDLMSFKGNKVKFITGMFNGCSLLKKINLLSFQTDKVKNMSSVFENCSSLKEINLPLFKSNKVTNISRMFKGCSSLK